MDENHDLWLDGFADGWSETNPDSEQIEHTVAKPQMRNSVSVEQIQEESTAAHIKRDTLMVSLFILTDDYELLVFTIGDAL